MYSYEKLERKLENKGITRPNLSRETGISSRTIAKISKGEKLSRKTLGKIADYLSCNPDDLYEIISDNPVLQRLREEKEVIHQPDFIGIRRSYYGDSISSNLFDTHFYCSLVFHTQK